MWNINLRVWVTSPTNGEVVRTTMKNHPYGDSEVLLPSYTHPEVFVKKSRRYRPRDLHGASARPLGVLFAFSYQKWSGARGHFGARTAVRRNVRLPCPEDI